VDESREKHQSIGVWGSIITHKKTPVTARSEGAEPQPLRGSFMQFCRTLQLCYVDICTLILLALNPDYVKHNFRGYSHCLEWWYRPPTFQAYGRKNSSDLPSVYTVTVVRNLDFPMFMIIHCVVQYGN